MLNLVYKMCVFCLYVSDILIKHQGTAVFELRDGGVLNLSRLQVTGIHLSDRIFINSSTVSYKTVYLPSIVIRRAWVCMLLGISLCTSMFWSKYFTFSHKNYPSVRAV